MRFEQDQEPSWLEWQARHLDEHVGAQQSRTGGQDPLRWARNWQSGSNAGPVVGRRRCAHVSFQRHENYAVLSAELLIDEAWFQKATLKIEYCRMHCGCRNC